MSNVKIPKRPMSKVKMWSIRALLVIFGLLTAFDTIAHARVLKRMVKHYCFKCRVFKWIKSFQSD